MKVLALVDAPEHVCCRYRIRAFEPAVRRSGGSLTVVGLARKPLGRLGQFAQARAYDAVILQRKLLPSWQLWLLRRNTRRLIFDFDDALLYRDSYDPRGHESPRRSRRFAATMAAADAVIAGNGFLADCALRSGARAEAVNVIPTCVAPAAYQLHRGSGRNRDGVDLVWIGSSSTLQGLEMRRSLWDRVGREVPGVRLRVICDGFPDLGALRIVPIPWSAEREAHELSEGDVGVTWVPDDLWSRGKCGLKVLQYQAAGLPVVANAVGVHNDMVRPGETGWLAETPEEWVEAIRALAADPEGRRRMGRQGRAYVEEEYSVSAWADAFVATIQGSKLKTIGAVNRGPSPAPRLPHGGMGREREPGSIEAVG
jgi:glycosyltransferase involved in cell wall biosynthesis